MLTSDFNLKLRAGDERTFQQLFLLLFSRLVNYCALFIKDKDLANDLVQDCFVKLWERRKDIKENTSIEAFLFVMLKNHCFKYLRDNKLSHMISLDGENAAELQQLYQLDFMDEEDELLEIQLAKSIKKGLDELPERRKEVFIKCKIQGKKQCIVAEELGISVKTVEKHLKLAKEQLKVILKPEYSTLTLSIALYLSMFV